MQRPVSRRSSTAAEGDEHAFPHAVSDVRTDPAERLALQTTALAAGGVAVAVRVSGALHYAFWQDEVASARVIVQRTPLDVLRQVARTESTPPAWYALGWIAHLVGVSVTDVRLVSVLAGGLLAVAVVFYARTLLPLWASGLAGLAVALGYQYVLHGRELRAYETHALLVVVLALSASRVVARPTRWKLTALALVVAVGALVHYFFLLSAAAVLFWLWTAPSARPVRRSATLAIAAGLVPLLVWSPALWAQYRHHRFSFIGAFDWHTVTKTYWDLFARAAPRTTVLHEAGPILLLGGIVVGCALLAKRSDGGRLCALLAITPIAVASLVWLAGPRVFDVRNLIGIGPFAAIALAALVAALPRPLAGIVALGAIAVLLFGFVRGERVRPTPYDRVATALVAEGWTPRDPIILFGGFWAFRSPLEWYLQDRPALTLGDARTAPCAPVFLVASRSARHRALRGLEPTATQIADGIVVARIGSPTNIHAIGRRGGSVVVARTGGSTCARPVPERLLKSRLAAGS